MHSTQLAPPNGPALPRPQGPQQPAVGPEESGLPFKRLLASVLRSRTMILAVTLVAAVAGVGYSIIKPNSYLSEAQFLVRSGGENVEVDPVTGDIYHRSGVRKNAPLVILTDKLFYAVAKRLGPEYITEPYHPPTARDDGSVRSMIYGFIFDVQRLIFTETEASGDVQAAVATLRGNLSVTNIPGSDSILVTYEANKPDRAQKILGVCVEEARKRHMSFYSANDTLRRLEAADKHLRESLAKARDNLSKFLAEIGVTDFDLEWSEARSAVQLTTTELTNLQNTTSADKLILDKLRTKLAGMSRTRVVKVPIISPNPKIGRIQRAIDDIESKLLERRAAVRPTDPSIVKLERQLEVLNGDLAKERARVLPTKYEHRTEENQPYLITESKIEDLEFKLLIAAERAKSVAAQKKAAVARMDQLHKHRARYKALVREVDRLQNELAASAGRERIALAKQQLREENISALTLLSEPTLPMTKLGPNRPRMIAGATLTGLFIALLIVVLRTLTDSRIRCPEDLAQVTGRNALAIVPTLDRRNLRRHKQLRDGSWS